MRAFLSLVSPLYLWLLNPCWFFLYSCVGLLCFGKVLAQRGSHGCLSGGKFWIYCCYQRSKSAKLGHFLMTDREVVGANGLLSISRTTVGTSPRDDNIKFKSHLIPLAVFFSFFWWYHLMQLYVQTHFSSLSSPICHPILRIMSEWQADLTTSQWSVNIQLPIWEPPQMTLSSCH